MFRHHCDAINVKSMVMWQQFAKANKDAVDVQVSTSTASVKKELS